MYRCTRKKGTIHVHALVVHVHGECSVRLPIGIEILRCVILGRLLVEHVDKSHSPYVKLVFSLISTHSLSFFFVVLVSHSYYPLCNLELTLVT